ncbi:MAG: protein kinase [Planctomycetia bacterium]|nr:protein kinase [Planctomycetia bacterium]
MALVTLEMNQKLRGYRLTQLRGKHEHASLWEAEAENGQRMALKFLHGADEFAARQEIRALQQIGRLQHPNLLAIEEVFSQGKNFIVVMKMADGSLQDYYDAYQAECKTGIEAEDLCGLLAQVGVGLDFLNSRKHHLGSWPVGIQHCNIKPSNLLMFGDSVKITDFGLASPVTFGVQVTRAGQPEYMAPEVIQGRLSSWSDQYSLAVTYCFLRGGRLPFSDVLQPGKTFHGRPAPDLTMLQPKERPVIARALSATPPQRWPTCAEMFDALKQALKG